MKIRGRIIDSNDINESMLKFEIQSRPLNIDAKTQYSEHNRLFCISNFNINLLLSP